MSEKINNSFRFIDDLGSLNDGSTFEKHYKDIYPTELELKKENNSNSCASFLDLYIYIENGELHTTVCVKILQRANCMIHYLFRIFNYN